MAPEKVQRAAAQEMSEAVSVLAELLAPVPRLFLGEAVKALVKKFEAHDCDAVRRQIEAANG